ncbi:MAG: ABC transporter permease [Opitutaceae bacterium]|nr:ABC transporter permease [Verrucomicrobiales bacterium]
MNLVPIIARELRVASRRSGTYWARLAAAVVCLLVLVSHSATTGRPASEIGFSLFMAMHKSMLLVIWTVVPLMACDAIAEERREGTLGLLFLTPLRAGGVVAGKFGAHLLRSLALWTATLPVLVVPLISGGVGLTDVATALTFQFSSILLALSAAMLASTFVKDRFWVAVMAVILAAGAYWCLLQIIMLAVDGGTPILSRSRDGRVLMNLGRGYYPMDSSKLLLGDPWQSWSTISRSWPARGYYGWNGVVLVSLIGAAFVSVLTNALTAWRAGRVWQDKVLSARERWLVSVFLSLKFWRGRFRRQMGRALERNPVGWLHQYSWKGRLTKWGWALFLVLAQLWAITDYYSFVQREIIVFLILLAGVAFSAANSFREEKQSGAFELLLVTPIRERQLSWGRYRGIVGQFIPTLLLVMLTAAIFLVRPPRSPFYFSDPAFRDILPASLYLTEITMLWAGVLGLPWLGLRLSLTTMAPTLAATVAFVVWLPVAGGLGWITAHYLSGHGRGLVVWTGLTLTIQFFIVLFAERGLTTILRERRFLRNTGQN